MEPFPAPLLGRPGRPDPSGHSGHPDRPDRPDRPGRTGSRGATSNPTNRFERLARIADPALVDAPGDPDDSTRDPRTVYLRDPSRSVLATNQSPDVGFDASVNPYRGCENGCAYCYARPGHEYLGWSAGLDFETKILVKEDAPALLRKALASPRWRPQVIALSGVTDPYQPVERRLGITRRCLEVAVEFRNPVAIITKSGMVTRDLDVLRELARFSAVSVSLSVTSLDADLQRRMEPRASKPARRIAAIRSLADAGIPVGVMVAPVIPGLTDHEMPEILREAVDAGAGHAGTVVLRLPHGVKELFDDWLRIHFPGRRTKVLNRLRALHGGRLYDSTPGHRQRGAGPYARQLEALFEVACRRAGLPTERPRLSVAHFRRPADAQLGLFD